MIGNIVEKLVFPALNNLGCTAALGMALGTITDAQISASSKLDNTHSAAQARLHSKAEGSKFGAWSALENDHHPWLQIDFGSSTKITRLATQGRNGFNEWVTRYTLEFCEDGVNFHRYKVNQYDLEPISKEKNMSRVGTSGEPRFPTFLYQTWLTFYMTNKTLARLEI